MRVVRHKKRGTTYEAKPATMQVSSPDSAAQLRGAELVRRDGRGGRVVYDGDKLVVYRDEATGEVYVRFPDEMTDGRFEDIPGD